MSGVRFPPRPPHVCTQPFLRWAFSFADFAHHAGFRAVLRAPPVLWPRTTNRSRLAPVPALSSLETCANWLKMAHAAGLVRQPLMRAPTGMVGSRVCTSNAKRQTRKASLHVNPWAGTGRHRRGCGSRIWPCRPWLRISLCWLMAGSPNAWQEKTPMRFQLSAQ